MKYHFSDYKFNRIKIFVIILILFTITVSVYFLYDSKTTKLNVEEVESVLTKEGFYDFYQRQENKFCTHTNDEEKQKEIINDIIWTLENIEKVEVREVKEVECEDGFKGILIK